MPQYFCLDKSIGRATYCSQRFNLISQKREQWSITEGNLISSRLVHELMAPRNRFCYDIKNCILFLCILTSFSLYFLRWVFALLSSVKRNGPHFIMHCTSGIWVVRDILLKKRVLHHLHYFLVFKTCRVCNSLNVKKNVGISTEIVYGYVERNIRISEFAQLSFRKFSKLTFSP